MLDNETYFNYFILAAKTQSDLEYLKSIKPTVLEKNFKVRINYNKTFSRDYKFLTQYQYIDLNDNYFDTLIKEQENFLSIFNPKFDNKEQETALSLATKIQNIIKSNKYDVEFYKQLEPLTIEELELMQSKPRYGEYFVGCNIYKYCNTDFKMQNLNETIFNKSIHTAINGLKIFELFEDENIKNKIKNKIKNNNKDILEFIAHKSSSDYFERLFYNFSTQELATFYAHKQIILLYDFLTDKKNTPSNIFDELVSDRLLTIAYNSTKVEEIKMMKENFKDLISKNKDLKDAIEAKVS